MDEEFCDDDTQRKTSGNNRRIFLCLLSVLQKHIDAR